MPDIALGFNDTIAKGESLQLQANGGVVYEWSPAAGLSNPRIDNPVASPELTTTYTVKVTDLFSCMKTGTKTITVQKPSYWIPKAFSPDGIGKNTVFLVRGDGIKDFEFVIFNSFGESLFHSNDVLMGWDGKKQTTGEDVPEGAYVYFVKGMSSDGTVINDKGLVNLIR